MHPPYLYTQTRPFADIMRCTLLTVGICHGFLTYEVLHYLLLSYCMIIWFFVLQGSGEVRGHACHALHDKCCSEISLLFENSINKLFCKKKPSVQ